MRKGLIPPRLILQRPTHPELLYHKLNRVEFQYKVSWPGMAIDLINNNFPKEEKSIRLIQTEEDLKQWLHLANTVFFTNIGLDWHSIKSLWDSAFFSFYGLLIKEEMAAIAMGYKKNSGLGIYMVAVAEAHRRKGFGAALTLHMLQEAKEQGCQAAYLQATATGAPLYQKIGFKTFCHFDIFGLAELE